MVLKVEVDYIESPDDSERVKKVARILAKGVYEHLKDQGLLRIDPQRQDKVRDAMEKAREIINRNIEE